MKTTYKVVAATGFRDHAEGERFEAELSEGEERAAIARGEIRRIASQPDEKPKPKRKTKGDPSNG